GGGPIAGPAPACRARATERQEPGYREQQQARQTDRRERSRERLREGEARPCQEADHLPPAAQPEPSGILLAESEVAGSRGDGQLGRGRGDRSKVGQERSAVL